ncbi:MAG: HAMP domain-containing histidine kinase, partial [Flavobacteriaceae bacterium]|nr:HAMP domain-containing histidine kinase [Flavobacteriaceae bacterium]
SNFQLTLDLLGDIESKEEEQELLSSLRSISNNLNRTITHLNEVVNIQNNVNDATEELQLEKVLQHVKGSIQHTLLKADATIYSDFSEVPTVTYIPAYLESIFYNLITNSVKYQHPDRSPVIDIFTIEEDFDTYLIVKDNGLGIDLSTYGDRLFKMYQTFHHHEDGAGMGLFLLKNQVEAMKGSIEVESSVEVGTTFKIKL